MSSTQKYTCDACGKQNLDSINVVEGPIEFCYRTSRKPAWMLITAGTKWEHICNDCRDVIEQKIKEISDVLRKTRLTVREDVAPTKVSIPRGESSSD